MSLTRRAIKNARRLEKASTYTRKIYWSLLLLCSTFFIGTIGFIIIEHYSLVDAIYMTVITVSTVGFTEVQPLTGVGKLFTSLLIVFNIGTFAYAVSTISSFIIEGEFAKLMNNYKVTDKIEALKEHVILCGYGRYGEETIPELEKHGIPFVIIENDKKKLQELQEDTDHLFIDADATEDDTLIRAGIHQARAIIITIADIAENAYTCLSARQLCPSVRIISRALDKRTQQKLIKAGANFVILPEKLGGIQMVNLVQNPGIIEFMSFLSDKGIEFEEISCQYLKKEYIHQTLAQLDLGKKTGAHIIGIREGEEASDCKINPSGAFTIEGHMKLICIGNKTQLQKLKTHLLDPLLTEEI